MNRKYLPVDTVKHLPHCSAPVVIQFRGKRLGDLMARCKDCGVATVIEPATEPKPEPKAAKPASRFRCREHLEQAVDWKGRGCHLCHSEHSRRRKRGGGGSPGWPEPETAGIAGPILASASEPPVFWGGDAA